MTLKYVDILNIQKLLLLNFENAVNIFENGSIQNSHNLMLYILIPRCNHIKQIQTLCCIRWLAMANLRRFGVTVNA